MTLLKVCRLCMSSFSYAVGLFLLGRLGVKGSVKVAVLSLPPFSVLMIQS